MVYAQDSIILSIQTKLQTKKGGKQEQGELKTLQNNPVQDIIDRGLKII
jgi:hypothetical protein